MAKIIKVMDYGYRKSITVELNPSDPEYVHSDGTAHPAQNTNGCVDAGGVPGCRYNRRVQEFVWTGDELYTHTPEGQRRAKTAAELLAEVSAGLAPAPTAAQIPNLVGRDI